MNTNILYTAGKRRLCLLLALVMLLSFLPIQAFAYERGPAVFASSAEVSIVPLNVVQVDSWAALSNAVTAAGLTPTTIEIENDIFLPAGAAFNAITIAAGQDITLTSLPGELYIIQRTGGTQRHFAVNGILRLQNVELNGDYPNFVGNHGGVTVNAGGSLFMEAGSAVRNNRNGNGSQGGGVTVTGAGATFTMDGGVISGNSGGTGAGGVFVGGGALFTMNNGEISENSLSANTSGGVSVQGASSSFVMTGGFIHDNIGRFGGGVRIGATGVGTPTLTTAPSMQMTGGEIYGNTAFFGGGVNLEFGLFAMTGGTIHDNIVTSLANPPITTIQANRGGGGVFLQNAGRFYMESGTISDNNSNNHGGGVMLLSGTTFNMDGGTISGNTATNNGGGVAAALINAAGNPAAGTIIINMSGGTIDGNTAVNGGGVWLTAGSNVASGSQLILTAGTISNNIASNNGGGIWLGTGTATANARLDLSGSTATISNNTAVGTPSIATAPLTAYGTGEGGGIYTSAYVYADPLPGPPYPYSNIIAPMPFAVTFSGNGAGGGLWTPPSNHTVLSFGEFLTNYDINFRGTTGQLAQVTFILNGGNVAGNPGNIVYTISSGATVGFYNIQPEPVRAGYTLVGWTRDNDPTILSVAEVNAQVIDVSTIFSAQWVPIGNGGNGWEPPPRPSRQAYLIGTADGYIRPHANITRAEVATIFFRLIDDADRAANWTQTNPFPDVQLRNWFNNAVSTTTEMGIFRGRPDGTFGPNQAITRAELTTAVVRFMDVAGLAGVGENQFNDIYGHWARSYINAAAMQSWVRGPHGLGGAFYPDRPITRAETAAIINRIFERLPETPADLLPNMVTWPDNANTGAWFYLYIQSATNSYTYERKADGIHERWTAIIPVRNWAALERPDSTPGSINLP